MSEEPEHKELPPTGDTEVPWAFCPDCGSPTDGKKFCPRCGRPLQKDAAPVAPRPTPPPAPQRAPKPAAAETLPTPYVDLPGLAFVAEFVPGLLGFLGVGWLYARRVPIGIGLLLGWWGLLVLVAASVLFLFGNVCFFLWLPFHVSIPLISAFVVAGELRQAQRRRLMGL